MSILTVNSTLPEVICMRFFSIQTHFTIIACFDIASYYHTANKPIPSNILLKKYPSSFNYLICTLYFLKDLWELTSKVNFNKNTEVIKNLPG